MAPVSACRTAGETDTCQNFWLVQKQGERITMGAGILPGDREVCPRAGGGDAEWFDQAEAVCVRDPIAGPVGTRSHRYS